MPSLICFSGERYKFILKLIFNPLGLTVPIPFWLCFALITFRRCVQNNVMLFTIYDDNYLYYTAANKHVSHKFIIPLHMYPLWSVK